MLTVVTWLWKRKEVSMSSYTADHVNAFERMLNANLKIPHRLICVTDMSKGINCETFPLWADYEKGNFIPDWPNCFRRLRAFSKGAHSAFGDRFVSMDLDCVITGDLTPILSRKEDFIIMEGRACHYNGSMWMMDAGCRSEIFTEFDPYLSPLQASQGVNKNGERFYGSDQAWISYKLGDGEATWTKDDGVFQNTNLQPWWGIPKAARIVFFAGMAKPWSRNTFTELHNTYNQYK